MRAIGRGLVIACFILAPAVAGEPVVPPWAYVVTPPRDPNTPQPAPDPTPRALPGTDVTFTATQMRDLFNVPDWYPTDHPAMPEVVAHGRKPGVFACGYCHLPNGLGRPENASLAGLPAAYIIQQLSDFKSGARKAVQPNLVPQVMMASIGVHAADDDVRAAAAYFAALKLRPWIRVIEADTVPKTRVGGAMLVARADGVEPIGTRIIEVPENTERTELRDSKSGFIAYVPKGSLKKGEALVTAAKPVACTTCHGADLRGIGPVPPLAGRSPSYLFRQLNDLKAGNRAGDWSGLMKNAVAGLSEKDMVNIVAYAASRAP